MAFINGEREIDAKLSLEIKKV